jgi:TatA/E family protein of Tat protein translocase
VLVVLFGAKKLPDSAKSIAKSLKVFRDEMKNNGDKKSDGENGTTPKSKK